MSGSFVIDPGKDNGENLERQQIEICQHLHQLRFRQ